MKMLGGDDILVRRMLSLAETPIMNRRTGGVLSSRALDNSSLSRRVLLSIGDAARCGARRRNPFDGKIRGDDSEIRFRTVVNGRYLRTAVCVADLRRR
jgi:hypothetical protein